MASPPTRDWHTVLCKLMNKINSNLLLFLKVPGDIVFVCTQLSHMKYDCHLCLLLPFIFFYLLYFICASALFQTTTSPTGLITSLLVTLSLELSTLWMEPFTSQTAVSEVAY